MGGHFSFLMGISIGPFPHYKQKVTAHTQLWVYNSENRFVGSFYHTTCRVKRIKQFFEKFVFWDRLMGTSASFKIVRTLASYIFSQGGQGTWVKTFVFAFRPITSMWKEVSRDAIRKLTSGQFWKCGGFCCYILLNQSYGCLKSSESEILSLSFIIINVV